MTARTPLRQIGRRLATLLDFLRGETAGGALLILASVLALAWSNSPDADAYARLLELPVGLGPWREPVHVWVNDALMALFFLLVALEIRREMTEGQLATWRGMAAPAVAALGGMIAPAVIFAALNHADPQALRGWAVPVATDIAFSLAVIRVLGARVPLSLIVFLTALAILDDLGAIVVIAAFYTHGLSLAALAAAAVTWLALLGLNRAGVRALWPYCLGAVVLWVCVFNSGIHATLAGVALAFVLPMRERTPDERTPARRIEAPLGRFVAWIILPAFGLANAGLDLRTMNLASLAEPAPLGILLGLFLGKQAGVVLATLAGRAAGVLTLPAHVGLGQLYGAAILCGIGFTMSLFIADLAFHGAALHDRIKLAVFCGSLLSAAVGLLVLGVATRKPSSP